MAPKTTCNPSIDYPFLWSRRSLVGVRELRLAVCRRREPEYEKTAIAKQLEESIDQMALLSKAKGHLFSRPAIMPRAFCDSRGRDMQPFSLQASAERTTTSWFPSAAPIQASFSSSHLPLFPPRGFVPGAPWRRLGEPPGIRQRLEQKPVRGSFLLEELPRGQLQQDRSTGNEIDATEKSPASLRSAAGPSCSHSRSCR